MMRGNGHSPCNVNGDPMVLYLSIKGSASLVRGKYGIFHLFLRANSLGLMFVVVESYTMDLY
jgi:hypothetical protein